MVRVILGGTVVAVGVKVGVIVKVRVMVLVGTGDPLEEVAPTKEHTQDAGKEKEKLFPETGTAVCWIRLLLESVNHGVTEVTVTPLNVKVCATAAVLPLIATMTTVAGDVLELFL